MKPSLSDFRVNLNSDHREVIVVPKQISAEITDILVMIMALYTATEGVNTVGVSRELVDQQTRLPINTDGNPVYCIVVRGYYRDGIDFVGPTNILDNVNTLDRTDNALCFLFLERMGEVDPPEVGQQFHHYESVSREILSKGKVVGEVRTARKGVTSLIRECSVEGDGVVVDVTFLIKSQDSPNSVYWKAFIRTHNRSTLGSTKDLEVYATFIEHSVDSKPEILN